MVNIDELDRAIGAHGMWKTRLKAAIDRGSIDVAVQVIEADRECVFGKWLHGSTLSPADKATSHYQTVRELHAEFHKTAARVARLAIDGKKKEARAMMDLAGEYTALSGKLTRAMMDWRKASK